MDGSSVTVSAVIKRESDDASALLSNTSNEVSSILKSQLETFKRLEEIPNYFSTLSINVSKESEQVSQILDIVASLSDASMELDKISGSLQNIEKKLKGNYFSPSH
jgi:uncharacterized protein YpuA (DUF1002 family)